MRCYPVLSLTIFVCIIGLVCYPFLTATLPSVKYQIVRGRGCDIDSWDYQYSAVLLSICSPVSCPNFSCGEYHRIRASA